MIQNFDPVVAPNRVVSNSGIEKVKIEKLIILMEVLKTSMRQFADISDIDLSEVIRTDSNDTIDKLDIDKLIRKLPSEIKDSVRERALSTKKLVKMFKDLDSTKISLNDFFVAVSDGGKGIEEALIQSLIVPLPDGMNILDFILKPVVEENVDGEEQSEEVKDSIKEEIKNEIKQEIIAINSSPIADAGDDQNVTQNDSITLYGSKSTDSDGSIEVYEWWSNEKLLDDSVSITLDDLSVGVHVLTLIVKDNQGAVGSDTVLVTVNKKEILVDDGNTTDVTDGNTTDVTDGNTTDVTDGNTTDVTDGNTTDVTDGNTTDVTDRNTTDVTHGNTTDVTDGNTTDVTDGNTTDVTDGNTTDVTDGNTTDVTAGNSTDVT
jgi:hypothetical protein